MTNEDLNKIKALVEQYPVETIVSALAWAYNTKAETKLDAQAKPTVESKLYQSIAITLGAYSFDNR